ncbi:MAG: DUF1893 domain-containing protein [Anaerolineales bacterium]|jgi:hypothetical protein
MEYSQISQEVTLQVFRDEYLLFQSDGKWLYPLFELEDFLRLHEQDRSGLLVKDKVIGKAAALLLINLEIGQVYAALISTLGIQVLEKYQVPYSFKTCVPRIACKTEEILESIDDPKMAYEILCKKAKRC